MKSTSDELNCEIDSTVDQLSALSLKNEKIGFVFDERMLLHKDFSNNHYECPERAMAVYMNLIFQGLSEKLIRVPSAEAEEEDILRVHEKTYLSAVEGLQYTKTGEPRSKVENKHTLKVQDNYDNYFTYDSAMMAAGSVINCCKYLMNKKIDHAFAIIRPPGHHANSEKARGFCYFNNIAIAAEFLIQKYQLKVAILDWDVHHGDGTQEIFYHKPNPLFISIHRHDNGTFYPMKTGKSIELGEGPGEGFNINIPWNCRVNITDGISGIGDDEYFYTFENVIIPVLKEYNPDVILVSCGFDAGEGDPKGCMNITPIGFAYMTSRLRQLGKNLIFTLEGGYNIDTIRRCSEAVIRTLLNDNSAFKNLMIGNKSCLNELAGTFLTLSTLNAKFFSPCPFAVEQVNAAICNFSQYWKCFTQISTPKRPVGLLRKDNPETLRKIQEILDPSITAKYLFNQNDEEFVLKNILVFKLGKFSIDKAMLTKDSQKYLRKVHCDTRTVSPELGFRLQGCAVDFSAASAKASHNERNFNWIKGDGIYDANTDSIVNILTKFLKFIKIPKEELLEKLEIARHTICSVLLEKQIDLYNVDLWVFEKEISGQAIQDEKEEVHESGTLFQDDSKMVPPKQKAKPSKGKSKGLKGKATKSKHEIVVKLNGFKSYSLSTVSNSTSSAHNFCDGLAALILFITDNILN